MRRLTIALAAACLALLAFVPAARAEFGFAQLGTAFTDEDGQPSMLAGSHPFDFTIRLDVNTVIDPQKGEVPDGTTKDLIVELPPGLVGTPDPVPYCSTADFLTVGGELGQSACPDSTAIGAVTLRIGLDQGPGFYDVPVHNLAPPPGVAAKFGFIAALVPVTVEVGVNPEYPHNLVSSVTSISQAALFYGSKLTLWGTPANPFHDPIRGDCLENEDESIEEFTSEGRSCSAGIPEKPFFTLPRGGCGPPLATNFSMFAWNSDASAFGTAVTNNGAEPPEPIGLSGCSKLGFAPAIDAQPTSDQASSPSGLDFNVAIDDENLTSPEELAQAHSDVKKAVVTLPAGVTINPSQAEGLEVCSEQDLARETASSQFGAGCPAASKIGGVEVETPLLEEEVLKGSLFVAEPFTNRFGSLLAVYMTIKSPERGISIALAGKVEPTKGTGPQAGRLTTTFDNLPQLPFSRFRLHFREGGRSPLITPPGCGTFETEALFTPWANPASPYPVTSTFQINRGVGGGACPPAGTPPFTPDFVGGSVNNQAGAHTPFYMRLTRNDGDQDLTRFDANLPQGLLARLAGVEKCSDGAILAAGTKSGKAELASPSCPAGSEIGDTLAGAGVGSQLTYVAGKLYLAGPFAGAPLSVVAITPAVAGPFDVGTVVVREALKLDPVTAEVQVDGANSTPIPHELEGIPLKLRELRVHVDRDRFTINPTSCDPSELTGTLWGGGTTFSPAPPVAVPLVERFQAAGCQALGFQPRLSLRLLGGTRRGANPALQAVFAPRPGEANLRRAVVRLPRSAFLDQSHIRTICTRVQFAADSCPKGAIYGQVVAHSPLLDEPLRGPVYLRSSDNLLPDLVFDLRGIVDIEASARIDSIRGGIRATFGFVPDAPLSKVVLRMQGGERGLIINSRNLCQAASRAEVRLTAHNNRVHNFEPVLRPSGCKKRR